MLLTSFEFWAVFTAFFLIVFVIDLYLTDHKKTKRGTKAAILWSIIWISVGLAFGVVIYFFSGGNHQPAISYITAYIIEKSLSVDNLFVFILIFAVMGISSERQPHILKWGIIGAIIFRIAFILLGVELLNKFHFMMYIFGAVIIISAIKILFSKDHKVDPSRNILVRLAKKVFPVNSTTNTNKFFIKEKGKVFITLSFITLLLIESSDIVFAIDSIPAVLAITNDPFIAITSNIFAILGLRALYFALAGVMNHFKYLKYGITIILLFVGLKMLIPIKLFTNQWVSLSFISICLIVSVLASLLERKINSVKKQN